MRILLWHGYLLGGTGSNVYTRMLAREWSNAGPRRHRPLQEPAPGALRPRRARRPCGPTSAGCCRSSCSTATRATTCDASRTARAPSSTPGSRPTPRRVRALLPADVVFTNHVLLGGPVGAATGAPFAVKAHGSELEYSMRGNPSSRPGARRLSPPPRRRSSAPSTSAPSCGGVRPHRERARGPAGRRHRRVGARAARRCPRRAARGGATATRRTPATPRSACPTRATPIGSRRFLAPATPRRRLLRQADRAEGRARPDRGAGRARRPARRRRVRPRARPRSRPSPPSVASRRCSPGPLEHRHLRHLLALADACVVPSIFPEAFGMVAAEAAAAGLPAARRPALRARRGRSRARGGVSAGLRHLAAFDVGRRRGPRPPAGRAARAVRRQTAPPSGPPPARAVVERWSWAGVSRRLLEPFA